MNRPNHVSEEYIPLDGAPYIPDQCSPHYWDSKHDAYGLARKLSDLVDALYRGQVSDKLWFDAAMACAMDHIKPEIEVIEVFGNGFDYGLVFDMHTYVDNDDYWEEELYS